MSELPAPEPGTHFGVVGAGRTTTEGKRRHARALHGGAASAYRIWRRGFWVGFEQGFDAAYKYVDPDA